jgi:hypothetical protein
MAERNTQLFQELKQMILRYNAAETFLFLEGLRHTDIVRDPLMWAAMQLYAFEPARLCADLTDLIEYEYETKESIFGEDEVSKSFQVCVRQDHAFDRRHYR